MQGGGDSAFPGSHFSSCPQEVALAFPAAESPLGQELGPAEKVKALPQGRLSSLLYNNLVALP